MAVIVKLGADISEVEKKAEEIPGAVDRAVRKGRSRKPWEGTGAEGSRSDYGKLANVSKEQERASEEQAKKDAQRKEKDRKESNADYLRRLKFNSKVIEDQNKADERDARNRQREQERLANAKDWSDRFVNIVGNGLIRTIGPWAAAVKAFQYAIESAREGLDRMRSTQTMGNLYGTNTQKFFDLQTAARKAGSNPEEVMGIVGGLQQRMSRGALGLDSQGLQAISILKQLGMDIDTSRVASGAIDAADAVKFLADKYGDLTKSQEGALWASQIFGEEYVKLIPLMREGSAGIDRLGGSFEKSQTEIQAVKKMDRSFGNVGEWFSDVFSSFYGGSKETRAADFNKEFLEYLDKNVDKPWDTTIKGMFRPQDQGGLMQPGETKQELDKRIREMFDVMKDRALTKGLAKQFEPLQQRYETESKPVLEEAKKVKGGGVPSLAIASSLQAMGGGDFASAITRGPVDMIAENTKATAEAAKETAQNTKNLAPGPKVQQPAIIGK